jgi:lipopolysaccharide/colanic/teichoic acid biosynthesis glycosyltransferase
MTAQPHFVLEQQSPAWSNSHWCNSQGKRGVDIAFASLALVVTAPLMLLIAVAIRATSRGPALFRQWRSGLNGHPFELFKFRTMRMMAAESGPGITRGGDGRITRVGQWLRRWKLDELPQLINVLRGEMSIVGPRPDLEQYWRQAGEAERQVLSTKPGMTGAASLIFRNEEELLTGIPESELAFFYVHRLLPQKARLDRESAAQATLWTDCSILIKTIFRIFSSHSFSQELKEMYEQVPR